MKCNGNDAEIIMIINFVLLTAEKMFAPKLNKGLQQLFVWMYWYITSIIMNSTTFSLCNISENDNKMKATNAVFCISSQVVCPVKQYAAYDNK